jgi:anaerobic magnesium-protoporphyrin IX monomethyl ester cyclase
VKIALFEPINTFKKGALNKDLAGGLGTYSDYGGSVSAKLLTFIKKRTINLPIISFAYIQAILKEKGHEVVYLNKLKNQKYDLILMYGSLVDFKYEVQICSQIKKQFPKTKVVFFGAFPTLRPEIFSVADSVIIGEVESFFLYSFKNIKDLKKRIIVEKKVDLNDLLQPNFDKFPIKKYSYFPMLKKKPFLPLQASRGCPYSCSYYCAYAVTQGSEYRVRLAEKIFNDVLFLIKRYKVKSIQFRDPTFGINKKQVRAFCDLIIKNKIKINWGIETRLDLLNKEELSLMFKAGLRNINVGIETINENIAMKNKRQFIAVKHQEEIIKFCKSLGIKIGAFYMLGLKGDTESSIKETIKYAIKLNTNAAQFAILSPFPGTLYYKELEQNNLLETKDLEQFSSQQVVFKHENLSKECLLRLRDYAFKKYYFRFGYLIEFLKWRIRECWL